MTNLYKTFGEKASVEHFVRKAIQKSYKIIIKEDCKINESGKNAVNLQQVKNCAEAFPICVSPYSLSVHYTEIGQEVNGSENQLYDVSSDSPGLS